ncbi:MAG: glycosyl hydrolase family 31, partial [Bacteroidales bacterium]|nr:glycosyl hydrolase family 31 [Bacteroidales bacterium]
MVKRILTAAFLAAISLAAYASEASRYNPVADPKATVEFGNARFTVLTPRLIRMEWAENGRFEDRATLAIVNRNLDVPYYKVKKNGGRLTLQTENLTLTYSGPGKFSENNLKVEFTMSDPSCRKGIRTVTWHPGMDESGNLLGTTRTLDKCDGTKTVEPYDPGVISRDGWAIIDESTRPVLDSDSSDWGEWVEERDSTDRSDLYIFAYGHSYREAIADFTRIAGKIPLPPKYAFGYWWSRYWQYSDFEFVDLAKTIRSLNIPMDVMVIDMDWHETWTLKKKGAPKDEFGQRIGWTGYTWQE